ncbi:MAG: dirigent protein [Hyphomicrobiales bacterium]|nr:dirigent protein [Hyphomicrobiales bacterium]
MKHAAGLAAFGLAAVTGQPVQAAEAPHCGKFNVYPGEVEVRHVDHEESGLGVGDSRIGLVRIYNEQRTEIGFESFHSKIVPGNEDGYYRLVLNAHMTLPNGYISYIGTYRMSDPSKPSPPQTDNSYPVVGGTGEFAGARGSVRFFNDDEGRRVAAFDLTCE